MRIVHFKVGDISEVACREDFIITDEHDSASETFQDDGQGFSFDSLLDTGCFASGTNNGKDDWQWCGQGADDDLISDLSDSEDGFGRFCQNCAEERDGVVCEVCGHDGSFDPCAISPSPLQTSDRTLGRRSDQDVILAYDPRMTLHESGGRRPHPERPDRLRAVMARLLSSGLADRCRQVGCQEASFDDLRKVHSEELIYQNKEMSRTAPVDSAGRSTRENSDLYVNHHTFLCSRLAAGGSAEVAAVVARKEACGGAAIVRPPGHHAESGNSMGFCFFNNAAVAARTAQENGAEKVLIMDWDVHHGNGTQQIFDEDSSVLYMSIHRHDRGRFYPGTGGVTNVGVGPGEGYSVNIPWDYGGMGDEDYIAAFEHVVLPIANEFKPDIIIISAGFDAAEGDPLGGCKVTPDGYAHLTSLLQQVAPLVLLLEGGYNLKSTALSTEACLKVLLGEQPPALLKPAYPSPFGWLGIQEAVREHSRYWSCLTSVSEAANSWPSPGKEERGDCAVEEDECGVDGVPPYALPGSLSIPLGGGDNRKGALTGKKEKGVGRSDRNQRLMLKIHHNAMKAHWRRRRSRLGSQTSESSFFSGLSSEFDCSDLEASLSASSNSAQQCPPPNSVYDRINSKRSKLQRLMSCPM